MSTARPRLARVLLIALALFSACSRGPSRDEALAAVRAARPALDSATVIGRVWQDGPPWFSCAEVVAKATKAVDSAAVRDQVGNWKWLAAKGWITLRDSASGPVVDPGFCVATVTPAGAPNIAKWTPLAGTPFPTGQPRRGWTMVAGRQHLLVRSSPRLARPDSATVEYLVTVAAGPDGVAIGADRDTSRFIGTLRRVDGAWRMVASAPAGAAQR